MLRRWKDPEIAAICDHALDAIVNRHYNPEIGLNTEMLYFDFSRPPGEERKSRLGHSIEVLWMAMNEANRRGDDALWTTCAERIHRHLDVGWDYVYGGLSQWVNVDQGGYQWPPETPVGTDFEFRFVGEYNYMKTLWGLCEVLIATLNVFERTGAEWAARYFGMAYRVVAEKFYLKQRGYPGYVLFADRRFTFRPHAARQDNYHPPRQTDVEPPHAGSYDPRGIDREPRVSRRLRHDQTRFHQHCGARGSAAAGDPLSAQESGKLKLAVVGTGDRGTLD